jgi:hypothetical protein
LLIGGLSTLTQYIYVVRQIAYIHGRESILLEIRERIQNKYMEEEDHFSLLYSQLIFIALAAAAMAARLLPLQLSFSPHSCTHSRFSLYLALKYKPPL